MRSFHRYIFLTPKITLQYFLIKYIIKFQFSKIFIFHIPKMWDLWPYVQFYEKHFAIISTSKTSFYINMKRFYWTNALLSIKIYAKPYEITSKFIKSCGAPTQDLRRALKRQPALRAENSYNRSSTLKIYPFFDNFIFYRNFIKFSPA